MLFSALVDPSTDESYALETFEEIVGGDVSVACARCNCNSGILNSSIRCAYLDNLQQPEMHTQCSSTAVVPVNPSQEGLETVPLALKACISEERNSESLPLYIQEDVLRRLKFEEICTLKVVSKGVKKLTESSTFQGSLTALYLHLQDGGLQLSGFVTHLNKWRRLATLVACLPHPDPNLLVSASGGLLCVCSVSKSLQNEVLVVCNPIIRHATVLPPLTFPRNSVLVHGLIDSRGTSYRVIGAGSAGFRYEGCQVVPSWKTKMLDSLNVPGPEFSLNEYQTGVYSISEERNWESLPVDIQENILRRLEPSEILLLKVVSKGVKKLTETSTFQGCITALYLHLEDGGLQLSGFDTLLKKWRRLLTLVGFLPHPDPNLLVSAGGGLLCVCSVSKSPQNEVLVVCNPMTRHATVLPPLTFRRNPVLLHLLVDPRGTSYRVIAAGSAGLRNEGCQVDLSRKTEVFDSVTSQWEVAGDLPGPEFCLNEYQTGVYINGTLYCVAILGDGSGKGVLAYNVEDRKWVSDWTCPLPVLTGDADAFFNAQLVGCDGEVYLFSELQTKQCRQETVELRIDKLENTSRAAGCGRWKSMVTEQKRGGRGLLQYTEYVCAGFGAGRLCIFNTRDQTGKVYDIHDRHGGHSESLVSSPQGIRRGGVFHTLNPLSFEFRPNFTFNISGTTHWPISLPSTESVYDETENLELFPSLL